jgi:hypothetical protein
MQVSEKNGFYTVKLENYECHFLTAWETIAFISGTDLIIQKN